MENDNSTFRRADGIAGDKSTASVMTSAQKRHLKRQQSVLCENLSFAASEAYKLLRANLQFTMQAGGTHLIGITSSNRGEGKSTTSINLAYSYAQSGKRVLLIDGDMRLPSVAGRLDLLQAPGLSNLLAGLCSERDALRVSHQLNNWFVLPSGDIPPNPSELLSSDKMRELLEHFAKAFDIIIIDLPPIGIVSDALVVSPWTDGLIVVVRQNYSDRRALKNSMYQIEKFNIKFLGFVMTDASIGESGYKNYGKYSQRNSDYSYADRREAASGRKSIDKAFKSAVFSEKK